jgi:hypothetical protein
VATRSFSADSSAISVTFSDKTHCYLSVVLNPVNGCIRRNR